MPVRFLFLGWALEQIKFLEINVNKYSPLGGSSYMKLPKYIEKKKAVVNVENQDQCCFAWAITSALYPAIERISDMSSYPHYSRVLNLTGMNFPVKLKDISKFEELNNISINVYGLEKKFENNLVKYDVVGPLRYSEKKLRIHVNLLLISAECDKDHHCKVDCAYCWIKTHYCWIF